MSDQGHSGAWFLRQAIRTTIRSDSDPHRQLLFANLIKGSRAARFALWLHQQLGKSWPSTLLVSSYGLRAFLAAVQGQSAPAVLTLAVHANARRQVERVRNWFEGEPTASVRLSLTFRSALLLVFGLLRLPANARTVGRTLRLMHRLNRRYHFLVSARVAACLACYLRGRELLSRSRPGVLVVSSDTNPEELGFCAAARLLRIPTVYIAHAYPTANVPALDFTLSILEGAAAVESRSRRGGVRGETVLIGLDGPFGAMRGDQLLADRPAIGIFTPKAVAWPALHALVAVCQRRFNARRVVIRWHPSMLEAPALDSSEFIDVTDPDEELYDVSRRCDWVVADSNSNVHLQVLRAGIPTVAVDELSVRQGGRRDAYGFISSGIVYSADTIDAFRSMLLVDASSFYSGDWSQRFRHFDASYLGDERALASTARARIAEVIHSSAARGPIESRTLKLKVQ